MEAERVRIDLAAPERPAPGVADLCALMGQPLPTATDADPVEAALRAQHAAWKLRDALSLADWLRFLRGYAVMLSAWDRGRL